MAFHDRFFRVHAPYLDRVARFEERVAVPAAATPLIGLRAVEIIPIEIVGNMGPAFQKPLVVVGPGTGLLHPPRPRRVHRAETGRFGPLIAMADRVVGVFHVGQRARFPALFSRLFSAGGRMAPARGIAGEIGAAIGAGPVDRHYVVGFRPDDFILAVPITIADDIKRLFQRADAGGNLHGANRLAARRVTRPGQKHFAPLFRHALIENHVPKQGRRLLPQILFAKRRVGFAEIEKHRHADAEIQPAPKAERPRDNRQRIVLVYFHVAQRL